MIIYLYLQNRYLKFRLPVQAQGSYSFDEKEDEEDKLINVDAKDGKWTLYSTKTSEIIYKDNVIENVILQNDSFYVLRKNNQNYIIYVSNLFNDNNTVYKLNSDFNLTIGNQPGCNIMYPNSMLNGFTIKINYKDNVIFLEKSQNRIIYINDVALTKMSCYLKNGDQIEIYGLRIYILNHLIIINNPGNKLKIDLMQSSITPLFAPNTVKPENIEFKDVELYTEDDYYLKSPRIRRIIEPKKIKITEPPKLEEEKELPLILTVGPMFTMGLVSSITVISSIGRILSGQKTLMQEFTSLVTSGAMLVSMILWPLLTKAYNEKTKKNQLKKSLKKYNKYLEEKRNVFVSEERLQRSILEENLILAENCLNIIDNRAVNFWDKRMDQSDFLTFRIGKGDEPLNVELDYHEDDFTLENNKLKEQVDALVDEFKYIKDVPIGYSFYENNITAVIGNNHHKCMAFVDNILLQLLTFYTHEDVRLVLFTNDERKSRWNYVKYLNHNFNDDRSFRFFSSNHESAKNVIEYLNFELNNRLMNAKENQSLPKPYYFIVVDGYDQVKRFEFIKELSELNINVGFSLLIIEEKMGNLPSKCSNFISIGETSAGVLKNSYEKQEQIAFSDEINETIDMMAAVKTISNIPIEMEDGMKQLPEAISFMEMEKVGKVEQLNILNRWNTNDATKSLKAEVGVDENNELIYLDLHEKFHGPHGLIAGMTGSGKSEFIITYILSLAINYSPNDVEFILIDYKGGGLAGAFENKKTGICLPHLAGTITNLDKAEMDRTLVSIDSEIKRRQKVFNDARDLLGESTIDIYKYQAFYKEGKLTEPVPHLFIICDEFAELKTQQPDFMDNLISVARIGRSLGVHLILATQKPSGVVNDQIWSNTKFRVCLKVQDQSDSNEMLKRPEAASLKQTGRFYLQVGYDELFLLGQSGWCGAKYFPSDKIVKQVDKSINFINDFGGIFKSAEASNKNVVQAQGEQLSAVMNDIIQVAGLIGQKARRLWLENIPEIILSDDLSIKYNVNFDRYYPKAVIGEYDAPENQEQGVVEYKFLEDGNTIIYGVDGAEREMLLNTLIYSSTKNYSTDELNYYIIDYGSESLRKYASLPHIGGIVFASEDEKYHNLLKLIKEELQKRKKLFADFGGEYKNYIEQSNNKLPVWTVVLNNYDSIYDSNAEIYDDLPDMVRDSERYGIIFIITASSANSVQMKIAQNFGNVISLKLKDNSDYGSVFGKSTSIQPRNMLGRGLVNINGIHEFQTASIIDENGDLNKFISEFIQLEKQKNPNSINNIPTLPDIVRYKHVTNYINGLSNIPIGIEKQELNICSVDLTSNIGNIITSNKLANTEKFAKSLIALFSNMKSFNTIVFDVTKALKFNNLPNYFVDNINEKIESINTFVEKLINEKQTQEGVIVIYGVDKFISKLDNISSFENLLTNLKKYEHIPIIIIDDVNKLKKYNFESWFNSNFNPSDGIWIGRGIADQSVLRVSSITKDMTKNYKNDMGYYVSEGVATLCRLIDFITEDQNEK